MVYTDKRKVKFKCNEQRLYIYKPNNRYLEAAKKENLKNIGVEKAISQLQTNSGSQLNTVKNQIEGFTKNKVKRSQDPRRIYCQLGDPTMETKEMIICNDLIRKCTMTTEDVNLANIIFGPDLSTLKGISTSTKPAQGIDDSI